ncbi:MAG TPA: hypothetical protein VJ691_06930 [Vicinamibacterales bacterium]|nr:hypothetical protein [Vicinamibacterales bacterium]
MRLRLAFVLSLVVSSYAAAQSFEAAIHIPVAQWSEFDGNDVGIGGRVTWRPSTLIGVDADLAWYPSDFPGDTIAFSGNRLEGLFGVTAGPQIDRVRPFAKVAGGFLRSSETPEVFPCITIFPPPLICLMAAGHTLPAFEIGGGVQFDVTSRTFARADVSGRWLRYPGPSFRSFPTVRVDNFWGSGLRIALAGGIRLAR